MPVPMRATWFFKSTDAEGPTGWTETLWYRTLDADFETTYDAATAYAVKRARLLGSGYELTTFRLSQETVFRDSRLSQGGPFTNDLVGSKLGPGNGDFAYSTILVRMESGAKNRRFMYLSGAPDDLQVIQGLPVNPAFIGAFNDWAKHVRSFWGFWGLTKDPVTNKAPKKVLNPNPPPKYTPRPMQLYTFDKVFMVKYAEHRRGRPFNLLRGRRKKTV